jgi:hypothetical protein
LRSPVAPLADRCHCPLPSVLRATVRVCQSTHLHPCIRLSLLCSTWTSCPFPFFLRPPFPHADCSEAAAMARLLCSRQNKNDRRQGARSRGVLWWEKDAHRQRCAGACSAALGDRCFGAHVLWREERAAAAALLAAGVTAVPPSSRTGTQGRRSENGHSHAHAHVRRHSLYRIALQWTQPSNSSRAAVLILKLASELSCPATANSNSRGL